MAGPIFWDVDTQYDFMHADGRLYVPGAETIIDALKALTDHAHGHGIRIVASADEHVAGHAELSDEPDFDQTFPPHCMSGTPGQQKIAETGLRDALVIDPGPLAEQELRARVRAHPGDFLFTKHWFDVFTNPNVEPVLDELDPEVVVVYGVALDVCNRYAIEGLLARRPRTALRVVTDATKPIVAAKAGGLLRDWEERGVALVTTAEVLQTTGIRTAAEEPHRV
jgi:nicotinamidase-related amidase